MKVTEQGSSERYWYFLTLRTKITVSISFKCDLQILCFIIFPATKKKKVSNMHNLWIQIPNPELYQHKKVVIVATWMQLWCHWEAKAKLKAAAVQQRPHSRFISCVTHKAAQGQNRRRFLFPPRDSSQSVPVRSSVHQVVESPDTTAHIVPVVIIHTVSPLKGTGRSTVGFWDQSTRRSQTASRRILRPWRRSSCSWRRNSRPGRQKKKKQD